MTRTRTNPIPDERPNLRQEREFQKFLANRRADAQRDYDRLDSEIDTLRGEIDSKIVEQDEHREIMLRCDAALTLEITAGRPAPQLTPHPATVEIAAVLDEIGSKKGEQP